jgi:eukaryotic translation initiation factor 2-alpha kinase 4
VSTYFPTSPYAFVKVLLVKPHSPHRHAVISALFTQSPTLVRNLLYDSEVAPSSEHASLNGVVQEQLTAIFRLHGAVDIAPPLFMPATQSGDPNIATFLDQHGDLVALPNNLLVPFARLAARSNATRVKRYHIADVYRPR